MSMDTAQRRSKQFMQGRRAGNLQARSGLMLDDLVGAWLLQSFHLKCVETGERSEPFGPRPSGALVSTLAAGWSD